MVGWLSEIPNLSKSVYANPPYGCATVNAHYIRNDAYPALRAQATVLHIKYLVVGRTKYRRSCVMRLPKWLYMELTSRSLTPTIEECVSDHKNWLKDI